MLRSDTGTRRFVSMEGYGGDLMDSSKRRGAEDDDYGLYNAKSRGKT